MAVTFVQSKGNVADPSTTVDVAMDSDVTSGNILLIAVLSRIESPLTASQITKQAGTATIGTVTIDRQRDEYNTYGDSNWDTVALASVPVTGTGSLTLRFTQSGTVGTFMAVAEASNVDSGGSRLEDSDDDYSTGAWTPTVPSMSSAGGAIFISMATADVHSAGSGFSLVYDQSNASYYEGYVQYKIVTGATSQTSPFGDATTVGGFAIGAVYKEAGGAPASTYTLSAAQGSFGV
jgi:hypothetical protein